MPAPALANTQPVWEQHLHPDIQNSYISAGGTMCSGGG